MLEAAQRLDIDGRELQIRLRDELTELAGEVDAVRRSEAYARVIEAMAKFWRYSPFNSWFIAVSFRARPGSRVPGPGRSSVAR